MGLRVDADAVRERMDSDRPPVLVCAYDDEEKCRKLDVEHSVTYKDSQSRLSGISKDREIVLFCG